jgi:hypothetical protein
VQQCGVGLVRIKRDGAGAAFAAPPLARTEVGADDLDAVLAALGTGRDRLVAAQWLKNGPNWLTLLLDSAATVLALEPDAVLMKRFRSVGVVGPHLGQRVRVRGPLRQHAVYENPVTSSQRTKYRRRLTRPAAPDTSWHASRPPAASKSPRRTTVWVGTTVTCIRGEVDLEPSVRPMIALDPRRRLPHHPAAGAPSARRPSALHRNRGRR